MRYALSWGLAYAFAAASTMLACLYAFMSASGFAAYGKAFILGLVAWGGCHGPMYAVKLWRANGWAGATLAVLATLVCLLVTLLGGLGTIVGGGAELRAERQKAASDVLRDRETLSKLRGERDRLSPRPTDVVSADLNTARASQLYKLSDGCEPEKISGPKVREHCKQYRQLEGELAAAKEAARIDTEIGAVDARLAQAPLLIEADPQAAALSQLTGFTVAFSQAVYAFLASIGAELMGMVAMMAAWGEKREPAAIVRPTAAIVTPPRELPKPREKPQQIAPPQRSKPAPANVVPIQRAAVFGSIRKFVLACLAPAEGDRLLMKAVYARYQGWCKEGGTTAAPLGQFLDEIEAVCERANIAIEETGGSVYCLNVCLAA